jgi:glycosyltransferase involved in cell wall biosynthesis
MPKLTVTMPVFNAEETVRSAMASTLRALPRDAKILVWDDASSDNTVDVIESLRDNRIQIHGGSDRLGGGAARNKLLSLSDSEYVASMDADDICFPWRFALQGHAIRNADVVFGTMVKFIRGRYLKAKPVLPVRLSADETPLALLAHNPMPHPSLFARRSSFEVAGQYRDLKVAQDYELWMRCVLSGLRVVRVAMPVIAYRLSETQVSAAPDYQSRIRASAALRTTYLSLLERFWDEDEFPDFDSENLDARALVESHLPSILSSLSGGCGWYYRWLLKRRKFSVPL